MLLVVYLLLTEVFKMEKRFSDCVSSPNNFCYIRDLYVKKRDEKLLLLLLLVVLADIFFN